MVHTLSVDKVTSIQTDLNSLAIRFGVICVPTSRFVLKLDCDILNRDGPCLDGFSGSLLDGPMLI